MSLENIFIWGASGHAKVIADILRLTGKNLLGFLDDLNPKRKGESFLGAKILGGEEALKNLPAGSLGIIGFGENQGRLDKAEFLKKQGIKLATIIHPKAVISKYAELLEGSLMAAGSILNPDARVGRNVILNTGSIVEHDCVLEDGVHIAPSACLGGGVKIGRATLIGLGAKILPKIEIGEGCIIGAGSVVTENIPPYRLAYGVSAKDIRPMKPKSKK